MAKKNGGGGSFHQAFRLLLVSLGVPIGVLALLGMAYGLLGGIGANTLLVNLHYGIFIGTLFLAAFLLDAILFAKNEPAMVKLAILSSFFLFLLTIAINISGIVADIPFSSGSAVSSSYNSTYGTFNANVTDSGVGNFTGPLVFDMMEHSSLVVPGIAAVIFALAIYYKGRAFTEPEIRKSMFILMIVLIGWIMALAMFGVILVKTLTYPPMT
jgi:hypothetical protein